MITPLYPTVAEVEHIAALEDPLIRNLQITQCYHELALALRERTSSSANWCNFAVWASKQAGQTIRKEDLARALENLLRGEEAAALAATAQQSGSTLERRRYNEARLENLGSSGGFYSLKRSSSSRQCESLRRDWR